MMIIRITKRDLYKYFLDMSIILEEYEKSATFRDLINDTENETMDEIIEIDSEDWIKATNNNGNR